MDNEDEEEEKAVTMEDDKEGEEAQEEKEEEEALEEKTKDKDNPMEVDSEEPSEAIGTCASKHLRKQKPSLVLVRHLTTCA
jgi:hypothetical protein